MNVIHILRDGSTVKDITGRVVKFEDAEPVYHLITSIRSRSVEKVSTYNKNDRGLRA
jgi:hypothetical protein